MKLRDTWHLVCIHGVLVVSFAFGLEAWRHDIGPLDYIAFSLSIVILSGAPLAKDALDVLGPRLSGLSASFPASPGRP